ENPDSAPSDGPNMVPLEQVPTLLKMLVMIDRISKKNQISIETKR
ncbi:MAG: hypothetical protein CFH36_02380, partial [Alphaproteobacteria bacterium MarineAlpha9_Bin6]